MSLLTPDSGLLFWMLISFGIVVFILTKYGFPVILKMVEERRAYIEESLLMAEKARTDLEKVKTESVTIIENARREHLKIIENATVLKNNLINDARNIAIVEASKIIDDARKQILIEKEDALRNIRSQVAELSIDITEKLLRNKLEKNDAQMDMINRLLDETTISKS